MNLPTGTYKLTDNGLKREPEEPKHPIEIMTQGKKFVLQPDHPMYSVAKDYDKTAKEIKPKDSSFESVGEILKKYKPPYER